MSKGEQAKPAVVADFQMMLETLCGNAAVSGVVLTVDTKSLQPLAMGNIQMIPVARAAWKNQD